MSNFLTNGDESDIVRLTFGLCGMSVADFERSRMEAQPRFLWRGAVRGQVSNSRNPREIRGPQMRVVDLIQFRQEVYSIREETAVHDAARYLRDHKAGSVGLRDARTSAGVISQSDISGKVAAEYECPAWMRVSEIRSRDLLVVLPEFPLMQ